MKHNYYGKGEKGRLVWLLASGYLRFTAALVIIFLAVFMLSNQYYSWLMRVPDIEGMTESRAFIQERYDDVHIKNYLGQGGAFAVLSEEGTMEYRSELFSVAGITEGELQCIRDYGGFSYIETIPVTMAGGETEYILIQYIYHDDGEIEDNVVILDEELKIKTGSLGDGKTYYTQREFEYLTGSTQSGTDLRRSSFTTQDGQQKWLVFTYETDTYDNYQYYSHRANRLYMLLIPLYVGLLLGFLMWQNKKIKDPLVKLNHAVEDIASGGFGRIGRMEGPWEIRQIGANMDSMADKLQRSEEERKRLDGERQKLLADISHDLKTPITVISGYTQAIRDGKVPEEKIDSYLELISSKASELTGMINSFHEYSKVEHPEFSLHAEETDICEFMRSYMAERYEEIEISGFEPRVIIPETRIMCMVDCRQLKRAFDNIVYNTIKHNSLGTLLAVSVSEKAGKVRITIADNGSGIPEKYRSKIFEPFIMGDESRHGDGSGLGLAITRNIIRAHGGEITLCDSAGGLYSTEFEIILNKI